MVKVGLFVALLPLKKLMVLAIALLLSSSLKRRRNWVRPEFVASLLMQALAVVKRTSKNKLRHCEEGDLPDEAISFTIWGLLREEHPRNDDQNGKLFLHVC
jgi:hypothetical protein